MFCSTKQLGKGTRCASPLHPPGQWLFQGIEPFPEPSDRIADQPLAGLGEVPLHLHRTMDQRAYRRPLKPTRGRLRSPCTHRSFQEDHGAIAPLGTTRRAWRNASPPAPNHTRTSGRPITNQGSVPAAPDTPKTTSWRPTFRSMDAASGSALNPIIEPAACRYCAARATIRRGRLGHSRERRLPSNSTTVST